MWGKAASKEVFVIQVTEAPVSNSQEKVFPPAIAVVLGLILSPLKGVIRSKNLLHVAIEIVHKFKINCGMTCGAYMRGVMMLLVKNRWFKNGLYDGIAVLLHCIG